MRNMLRLGLAILAVFAAPATAGERVQGRASLASEDGSVLVLVTDREKLTFLRADGGTLSDARPPSPVVELAFSSDASWLGGCLERGGLLLVDVASGKQQAFDVGRACGDLHWLKDGRLHYVLLRTVPDGDAIVYEAEIKALDPALKKVDTIHTSRVKNKMPGPPGMLDPQKLQTTPVAPSMPPVKNGRQQK